MGFAEEVTEVNLPTMFVGATYQVTIELSEDEEEKYPVNLTGQIVELEIGEHVLTEGNGLRVTPKTGTIEVEVQASETAQFIGSRSYTLWLKEGRGVEEPLRLPEIYGPFNVRRK